MILRSQIDPIPHITDLSFSGNELNLTVENLGSGPAARAVVFTSTKYLPKNNAYLPIIIIKNSFIN